MTKTRSRLNPNARQQHLLLMAIQAYARLGVERAGHGDVAKLAHVSTATVFNYFPSRDALTKRVFLHVRDVFMTMFDNLQSQPVMSKYDLIHLVAHYFDRVIDENPDVIKVFLNWSAAFSDKVRPTYLELQEDILDRLTQLLDGQYQDARIILGSAHIYAQMKFDRSSPESLERLTERIATALSV